MPLILIFCCQLYICGTSFDITDTFRLLARFKILQMHHAQRLAYSGLNVLRIFSRAQAERNVFKHRHMRPERKILKHKAKASPFRRQIDSLLPGKYARAIKINFSIIRRFQPRDHPQKRRLSAAGRAKVVKLPLSIVRDVGRMTCFFSKRFVIPCRRISIPFLFSVRGPVYQSHVKSVCSGM